MLFFKLDSKGKKKKVAGTKQDFKRKGKVGKKASDSRVNRGDKIGLVYDKKGKKGYL